MLHKGISSKKNVTYFVLIKAQIELSWTVQDLFSIHTHVLRIGLESDLYIHMYTISQDLKEALGCFISVLVLGERWSLSWNAMINGYGWIGNLDESPEFFDQRPFKNVLSWDSLF